MARQPRIEYPGAYYHVMARGDRQEAIFADDEDRRMFLRTLGEACERARWRVLAWVLMENHYHLVLQTPEANLVAGMKWFQNTYTRRLNTRHKLWGHVFGGRYKAIVVESEGTVKSASSDYLATLLDYVHLNPARAGLADGKQQLMEYRWSSLSQAYAVRPPQRAPWIAVEEGLAVFGLPDTTAGRRKFADRLEARAEDERASAGLPAREELETLQSTLRRGWYWGSQAFREKLGKLVERKKLRANRNYRASALSHHADQTAAEELLSAGVQHFRLHDEAGELRLGRSTQAARTAVAWAIHRKTNRPQAWIANVLGLKSPANVSQQVRRFQRALDHSEAAPRISREVRKWINLVKNH